jgi:exosortase/archaeosortase family protein
LIRSFYNSNKESIFVIIKLLVFYQIILAVFFGYIGLIDPKGNWYFPFLDRFNLVDGMLHSIIYPVKWLLELLGYETRHTVDSVGILNGRGVRIAFGCLGIRIFIAFTTLFLSFPGKNKLIFWLVGIFTIQLLNIARIFSIVYFNDGKIRILYIAHNAFNYASYIIVVLFFYLWYKKYSKKTTDTN